MTSCSIEHPQMIKLYECLLMQPLPVAPFYSRRCGPLELTLQLLVAKFKTTSSVNNQPTLTHQGNARSLENIAIIHKSVKDNPRQSIPLHAQELALLQTPTRRILRQDLAWNFFWLF